MRKPTICMGENKDADQLLGNREADQRLCFRYTDSTFFYFSTYSQIFEILGFFCDCTGWFVLDLVGNPNCWFCHEERIFTNNLQKQRRRSAADRHLCFCYTDSTMTLLPISKISGFSVAIFCNCIDRFVSDLVGNPEDWFSRVTSQLIYQTF